jgi:hypothetical protein
MLTCGKPGDSAITCGRGEVHEMRSRFEHLLHIGPYGSLGERPACGKAVADGVWSPPGGSGHFVSQQADTIAGIDFADALKPGPRNGGNSPITVAQIIAAVTRGLNTTIGEGLQIEAEQFARMVGTYDLREALDAWIERRSPAYQR